MTFDEYRNLPGINATAIKAGRVSMKHMNHAVCGTQAPPSPAMRMGSLIHLAVLEPEDLWTRAAIWDEPKRGPEYKDFTDSFGGEYIVTQDEANKLDAITNAILSDPNARELIEATDHEVTLQWEDELYGKAKARPDGLSNGTMIEVKTTGKIDQFEKTAYNLGYTLQLGWYWHGSIANEADPNLRVWVIVIEQGPPHDVVVYKVSPQILEDGYDKARLIAQDYKIACHLGTWQGVSKGEVLPYELPKWASGGNDWKIGDDKSKEK